LEVRCGVCADEKRKSNLLGDVVAIDGTLWWRQHFSARPTPEGLEWGLPPGTAKRTMSDRRLLLDDASRGFAAMCSRHPGVPVATSQEIRDALRSALPLWVRGR
jgi:hypothetical protein